MKYITAIRKAGDRYDAFYSDDSGFDPDSSWSYIKRVARKYDYQQVRVDRTGCLGEGEVAHEIINAEDL